MKKLFAATVLATVLAGLPALALAAEKAVEGTIQSVDPAGQTVTLVDGMTFTVAPAVSTEALQPGEDVTVIYQNQGKGDPVATVIFIDAGPNQSGN
jgi:Cu/Ag efflux protein CusF